MKLIARANLLILLFLLVAGIVILVSRVIWQNLYLFTNSDFLFVPSLSKDYAEGIYDWRQWILPPAPSFFPDIFIFFLISIITKNLIFSSILYGLVIAILLIKFTSSTFRLTGEYFKFTFVIKAVTLSYALWFILISFFPKDIGLFLIPSYHGGSLLFSIILYSLFFKINNNKNIYLILLISVLAIISDKQIIYTFYIPYLTTSLLLRNDSKEKYFGKALIYLSLSSLFGWVILKFLLLLGIFDIATIPVWNEIKKNILQLKVFENIYKIFPEVLHFLIDFYSDKFMLFVLFVLSIVLNIYYALSFSKSNFKIRFLSIFILLVYFSSFISQMFFGIWGGFRYVWAVYLFPYLSILFYSGNYLSKILNNKVGRSQSNWIIILKSKFESPKYFQGFAFILLLAVGYLFYSDKEKGISLEVPYPPFISCLDTLKNKYNLTYGLSDYWNAKHIRYLSQKNLIVNQAFVSMEKYDWVHNREWYKKNKDGNPILYNFIIPERLNQRKILDRFGKPEYVETCEGRVIFIYPKGFAF